MCCNKTRSNQLQESIPFKNLIKLLVTSYQAIKMRLSLLRLLIYDVQYAMQLHVE